MRSFTAGLLALGAILFSAAVHAEDVVEPDFIGVFMERDPATGALSSLPREKAQVNSRVRGLGFGGAVVYATVAGPTCAKRISAGARPEFVLRVASQQEDPYAMIQFYKMQVMPKERRVQMAHAHAFSSRSTTDNSSIPFDIALHGKSSLRIVPGQDLAPGEYVFSLVSKEDVFCLGVDPA